MKKLFGLLLICFLTGCGQQKREKIEFSVLEGYPTACFLTEPTKDTTIVFSIARREHMLPFSRHEAENNAHVIKWKSPKNKFFFICKQEFFTIEELVKNVSETGGKFVFPNRKTVNIVIENSRKVFEPDPLPNWK